MPHRADDLLPEENDVVNTALKRLQPQEAYDRVFRMRRAFQVRSTRHTPHHTCHPPLTRSCSALSHTSFSPRTSRPSPRRSVPCNTPKHLPPNCLHIHQDIAYLSPIIKEIEAERRERMDLDAMVIKK